MNARRLGLACFAGLLLVAALVACKAEPSVEQLMRDAKQFQQKGDNVAAQIQLKNVLQKNPVNLEARYLLGVIAIDSDDARTGEKELRAVLGEGMAREQVLPLLVKSMLLQGHFQPALDELAAHPPTSGVLALRGNAYLGLGTPGLARQAFGDSLKLDPDDAEALLGMARCALLDGDMGAVNAHIEHALGKHPEHADALLFKARLLRSQGANEAAQAAFNRVLTLYPGNIEARLTRAEFEIAQRAFEAAHADLLAAQKTSPQSLGVQYMQGVLYFSEGDPGKARTAVDNVLREAPDYMPAVLLAGAVHYKLGADQAAEPYLSRYVDANPANMYARKLLTSSLLRRKQVDQARRRLEPGLRSAPQDPELLTLAGEVALQARDFAAATEYFEQASARAPGTARLHTAIGMSKMGQGRSVDALAELETASTLDKNSPQAGILLAMTHLRMGEFDKALATVQALEKVQPANPMLPNLKGGIFLGKNDSAAARASFEKALALDHGYFPAAANLAVLDLKAGQPAAARQRFLALLEINKKDLQAMTALASLAQSQHQPAEATGWLERAAHDHPEALLATVRLATHYLQSGAGPKALALARLTQQNNPANPDALGLLAQVQFATGDKRGALESYTRLAGLLPNVASVQLRIAEVQLALGESEAAANAVRRAWALEPENLDVEFALASLYMNNGSQPQALKVARQIQQRAGQALLGYVMEGHILMAQKKPALAAKAYQQAAALAPDNPRLQVRMLDAMRQGGQAAPAEAQAQQWFKSHPQDTVVRAYLAESALGQRSNKAAIEQYQQLLRQRPDDAMAMNNLAWAYQQEKDPRALALAEQAYQRAGANPAIADTLGWILLERGERGDLARALALLQKAGEAAPALTSIRYHWCIALYKSGDKARARSELEKLVGASQPFAQRDEARALLRQW